MRELGAYLAAFAESDRARTSRLGETYTPTGFTPTLAPIASDPYDYARQTAVSIAANANFDAVLSRVAASTAALNSTRAARLSGALEFQRQNTEAYGWLMPLTRAPCPPDGAAAYIWEDVWNGAKANLAALSATPPTRYTSASAVLTWTAYIRWNWALLADATNVRPMFLFPSDYEAAHAAVYIEASTGLPVNGKDHVREFYWDEASPQNTQVGVAVPNDQLGQFVRLDSTPTGIRTNQPKGTVHFVMSSDPRAPSVSIQLGAIQRGLLTLAPQSIPNGRNPSSCGPMLNQACTPSELATSWDVVAWIRAMGAWARAGSRLSLSRVVLDAMAFYLLNHVTFWKEKGRLTFNQGELRAAQQTAIAGALRGGTTGMITGSVGAIATLVSPVVGAVVGILSEVGFTLLGTLVGGALSVDGPRPFFVRVPADSQCAPQSFLSTAADVEARVRATAVAQAAAVRAAGAPLMTPSGTTTAAPQSAVVPAIGALALAFALWKFIR